MWHEITYPFPNFNGTTVEVNLQIDKQFCATLYWAYMITFRAGIKVNPP